MDNQIHSELPPLHNPEQTTATPQGSMEALQGADVQERQMSQRIEQGISAPTLQTTGTAQAQQFAAPITQPPVQPVASRGLPQIADDSDLIEKEWVAKAKEIIARTKFDPHEQNKEVGLVRADYMKKRYNKDIKTVEE